MMADKAPYWTRLIIILCLGIMLTSVVCSSTLEIKYYLKQSISSDPKNFKLGNYNWSWQYWGDGRNFNSTIAGWGNTAFSASIKAGQKGGPFEFSVSPYVGFKMPTFGVYETDIWYDCEYSAIIRRPKFTAGITSWYVAAGAMESSFRDMGDPLGAFKLPNTTMPKLTFRIGTKLFDWNTVGYYMRDNYISQVPASELIPDSAYEAWGMMPGSLSSFNEEANYCLLRSTKSLANGWDMGLNIGQKEAYNVPRSSSGYVKRNKGFDLKGKLRVFNQPSFIFAFMDSTGEWRKYTSPAIGVEQKFDVIGRIQGRAGKLEVNRLKLGPVTFNGSLNSVEPGFQWVAVRDVRYGHNMWSAILDRDFILRDPSKKKEYMSDVSLYLGQQTLQGKFEHPGQIELFNGKSRSKVSANYTFEIINANKLGAKKILDLVTLDELDSGYRQLSSNFEVGYNPQTKISLFNSERSYHENQDYKNEYGARVSNKLRPKLSLEMLASNVKRLRQEDKGIGNSNSYQLSLKGSTARNITLESNFDYRVGNYNYRLVKDNVDRVLDKNGSFLVFSQYAEADRKMEIVKQPISLKIAGEASYRQTDIPNLTSGLSLVGFVEAGMIVGSTLITLTSINVTGPQSYEFPTGELHDLQDAVVFYKPFSSPDTTLKARYTRRHLEGEYMSNWYIMLETNILEHKFEFIFGGPPSPHYAFTEYLNYYFAGSLQNGRHEPSRILKERPWEYWGIKSMGIKKTLENYFTMRWSIEF